MNASYFYGEDGGTAEARRIVVVEESTVRCYNIWDCYFTRQSLLNEVRPFGFAEEALYGDVTGESYTEGAPTMCVVLKKE